MALGLITAWFFPPAHLFFSLGLIMATIAMATHQVRAGLLLLAGTLAGATLCAVVFLSLLFSPRGRPASPFQSEPPRFHPPALASLPAAVRRPVGAVTSTTAARPWRLDEVKRMLNVGWNDAQVIAAIAGRPRVEALGPSDVTELRALGAGVELIDQLGGNRLPVGSAPVAPARMVAAAPLPVVSIPPPAGTPINDAARDRRIESLNQQINALDDQIRTFRNHPGDSRYQAATQTYLDQLDRQRNALRREKWQLEGR